MKFRSIFAAICLVAFGAAAHADNLSELRAALRKAMPSMPADARIVKTPYAGLYEIDFGDHVFYADATGRYLFAGEILDTRSGVNVTKQRVAELQRFPWKDLPFKDSFKLVYGNGERQVAVFEDPYCPYCHRLEKTLEAMGNITVHVFLFPVIRPDSPARARDIWCSADRARAWTDWMDHQKVPAPAAAGCKAEALQANLALGQRLGIESTPTMFLQNGTRIAGAVEAADITRAMAAK